jgi:hypothetical protein
MIFGKLRHAGPLSVRVMHLLGAAFLIVFDVALAIGLRGKIIRNEIDDPTPLGTPSALSITIMLLSSLSPWQRWRVCMFSIVRERRP